MSYIDRPSRLRAPALTAAALLNAGLFVLATQFAGAGYPPSRPAQQALVTITTTHSTPTTQPVDQQREKPKRASKLNSPSTRSAYSHRHSAADRIVTQIDPVRPPIEMPQFALHHPPRLSVSLPSPSPVPVSQTHSPPDLLAAYSVRLRALILARQPTTSASSGQVTIAFEVAPTGELIDSAVAASSGNVQLDRTALNMVRRAAPFPRPDQVIPADKLHFRIEVRFH